MTSWLCRSSLSAALLQSSVVGRYASAPDLQALVSQGNAQPIGRGIGPDPTPARAPPPGTNANKENVSRSRSYGQPHGGHQSFGGGQTGGKIAYSAQPILGKAEHEASAAGSQYALQVMQHNEHQVAAWRQLRSGVRLIGRNWELLLVLGVSMVNVFVCLAPMVWS